MGDRWHITLVYTVFRTSSGPIGAVTLGGLQYTKCHILIEDDCDFFDRPIFGLREGEPYRN